jgi:hypothetical protein
VVSAGDLEYQETDCNDICVHVREKEEEGRRREKEIRIFVTERKFLGTSMIFR